MVLFYEVICNIETKRERPIDSFEKIKALNDAAAKQKQFVGKSATLSACRNEMANATGIQ